MLGSPFKKRAHYVFNYKPRYYDERKERLQKLEEQYHGKDTKKETGDYQISLTKNNLKNDWAKTKSSTADAGTTKRLAIIIAILVGIVAYIFELHTLI